MEYRPGQRWKAELSSGEEAIVTVIDVQPHDDGAMLKLLDEEGLRHCCVTVEGDPQYPSCRLKEIATGAVNGMPPSSPVGSLEVPVRPRFVSISRSFDGHGNVFLDAVTDDGHLWTKRCSKNGAIATDWECIPPPPYYMKMVSLL